MAEEHRPNTSTPPDEESVFSRVMNTRVAQVNRRPNGQVAAVIVFNPNMTIADANDALSTLSGKLESTDVQEFNPQFGGPVLYFP